MTCLLYRWVAGLLAALIGLAVVVPSTSGWADSIRDKEWHLGFLRIAEAHRISQGAGVVVAVIDTGVDAIHPDLVGNVLPGMDVQPGATGDGRTDVDGHGTSMAGLIVGHGHGPDNSQGVFGVAPQATVLPVRDGNHRSIAITEAIVWATTHNAKVISIAEGDTAGDLRERRAVEDAIAHDIVVIAGAGNIPGTSVQFPAAFPGVVAVTGVDQHGEHAEVSITGSEAVLSAPAVDIMAIQLGQKYGPENGTSGATAIVAGVAALVRAKYPDLSATEVVHRMTATAIDKGSPGRDPVFGYGIVNPVGALTADVPPLATASRTPADTPSGTATDASARAEVPPWLIGVGIGLAVVVCLIVVARRQPKRPVM